MVNFYVKQVNIDSILCERDGLKVKQNKKSGCISFEFKDL